MIDFGLTLEGDLKIEGQVLETVTKDKLKVQKAKCCVQSIADDWYMDNVGSDLEQFLGLPCTDKLADAIKDQIVNSLIQHKFFIKEDIYIESTLLSPTALQFRLYLKSEYQSAYKIDIDVNAISGIHIRKG